VRSAPEMNNHPKISDQQFLKTSDQSVLFALRDLFGRNLRRPFGTSIRRKFLAKVPESRFSI
tara:strand:+ start:194 stop:379 length:186 start_codon:yes stop_codon:yes gene_type:complete